MPSREMSHSEEQKQYYLLTNETSPNADSWKLPYNIDDSDLTFDGKPLNLLYEENRQSAEHQKGADASRDGHSSGGSQKIPRGRSRQSKK